MTVGDRAERDRDGVHVPRCAAHHAPPPGPIHAAPRTVRLAVVSDEEAEARRADRALVRCIAVTAILAVLGAGVSFAFFALAFGAHFAAWGCAFWAAKAKGYPAYFGIMGPLFGLGLPSLHPTLERVRRWEAAHRSRSDGPSAGPWPAEAAARRPARGAARVARSSPR